MCQSRTDTHMVKFPVTSSLNKIKDTFLLLCGGGGVEGLTRVRGCTWKDWEVNGIQMYYMKFPNKNIMLEGGKEGTFVKISL